MKISKVVAVAGIVLQLAVLAQADVVVHVFPNLPATGYVTVTSNPDRVPLLESKVFWKTNQGLVLFLTKDLKGYTNLYYTLHDFKGNGSNHNCVGSAPEATVTDVPGTNVSVVVNMTLVCN